MANKYHFTSIELWAVGALYNIVSGLHRPPPSQYDLGQCTSGWMKRLMEVALLCGHTALHNDVAEQWVNRIVAHDLCPTHALEIADRSGVRRLQGCAYYAQLLEMDDNFEPSIVEDGKQYSPSATTLAAAGPNRDNNVSLTIPASGHASTLPSLTREQRERLSLGHWSLTHLWDRL